MASYYRVRSYWTADNGPVEAYFTTMQPWYDDHFRFEFKDLGVVQFVFATRDKMDPYLFHESYWNGNGHLYRSNRRTMTEAMIRACPPPGPGLEGYGEYGL